MFKKIMALVLTVCMMASLAVAFAGCNGDGETQPEGEKTTLKVGAILIGNEGEGYTKAHMDGITGAIDALKAEGYDITITWRKDVPEGPDVKVKAEELIAAGCEVIITNSYGHQFHLDSLPEDYPEVPFICMTGDLAAGSAAENDYNAFTRVFESRYVSGVVAGLKLKALVEAGTLTKELVPTAFDAQGNIKIGYVGAFNYQEVVSGYTAFYLGVKSVVENVAMTVKYTNSWFDIERESEAAKFLMAEGCVVIGQHADSTGAPIAVQTEYDNSQKLCFSVGYNISMLGVAEDVALTSATNNWSVYYTDMFRAVLKGEAIPQDWAKGYADGAVAITELGTACAAGTQNYVDDVIEDIKSGELKVFDCSKFSVNGEHLNTYTGAYNMNGAECLKTENGVTYFDESSLRAAPYFDIRIDGITEIAYEE